MPADLVAQIDEAFAPPLFDNTRSLAYEQALGADPLLRSFAETNVAEHKNPAYGIVSVSLKPVGGTPGDATADQMRVLADLAERYGHDELRISHEQNVILPHVRKADIPAVHAALREAGLATANIGLVSDIIACPGMDYCALATARSIPVAQAISNRFDEPEAGTRYRSAQDQDLRLHQCLRSSPCRPHRHTGAGQGGA